MKRLIAVLLLVAMILPITIGNFTLRTSASAPAAGKYVITGGGTVGAPDYTLDTTSYTGAELGTVLAAIEAPDSGVNFESDLTATSGIENYVVELVLIEDNTYAIKLNNGQYLAEAGTSNLVSYNNYDANIQAQWTIDVSDGVWTIQSVSSPEKYLAYSASAHYFRTFTSGGSKPVLYSFTLETGSATHEFSLQQSIRSTGSGTITATYGGRQYVHPESGSSADDPTVFTVTDGGRVTVYLEADEGSALSKVRVNGMDTDVLASGDGYSFTASNITADTFVTAIWVDGSIDNEGSASTAVYADYENTTYGLEGTAASDPITTAQVDESNILEGSVFADKSVHYNEDSLTFTNTLSVNSVAYESATSESIVIPMDIMVVLDISGSMGRNTITGNSSRYRMHAVADELNNLMSEIIAASPYNRVGLVTYSGISSSDSTNPLGSNAAIDVALATHDSITFSFTKNTGSDANSYTGDLEISVDGASAISKRVEGGTYTQSGIGKAYEAFRDVGDKTVTINGQTYERTPVIILVTDGCPTLGYSDYTLSTLPQADHGNGVVSNANSVGLSAIDTLNAAFYFRDQIKALYDDNSRFRFYTIGVDTNGESFVKVNHVVLNPVNDTIDALTETTTPYTTVKNYVTGSDYMAAHYEDGEYITYADGSYLCSTDTDSTSTLHDAFESILTEAQAVITHIMPLVENSTVEFYDALGEDMELKSDPVLTYNGQTYSPSSVTTSNGKTYYHYTGTVQSYANGPTEDLSTITVSKEQDENGIWIIRWILPSEIVPAYVYDETTDDYLPALSATLSYDVAPTDAALADVTNQRSFYSNYYDEEGYHAYTTYQLNQESPFYTTYYGSLNPVLEADKLDNASETDTYIGYTTHDNGSCTKKLGNNGVMTVSAKTADITLRKVWKEPDGTVRTAPTGAEVVGQLWKRIDGTTEELVDEVTLNADNTWQYTWEGLTVRDASHTYTYFGKEISVSGADDYDCYAVEEADADGEIRLSNYYNRMTITVNTDWYYNGISETDTYENRTINTLYYKDSTGQLIAVSSVDPIVFDSTNGLTEDWNDKWIDLPIRNADGTVIEYVVVQEIVNEDLRGTHTTFYTVEDNERKAECESITGVVNPDPVVQIDNYLENPPISVTVLKVWSDNSGDSQDDITVGLYRSVTADGEGRLVKSATFGKAQNWAYTFEELAPGYYYYVRETKVSGYTTTYSGVVCQKDDGNTPIITVTNTPYPTTGIAVEKVWKTDSGTTLLDASDMPSIKVNLMQIDHAVTEVPTYTVTVRFYGRTRNSTTDRTVATSQTITNVKQGGTATLTFGTFSNLRLYNNTNSVTAVVSSGTGTLDTSNFTHASSTSSSRYYMKFSGSISVTDVQSDVVITVTTNRIYSTTSTFSNQNATTSTSGGLSNGEETTTSLYQTAVLSAENGWFVSYDNAPLTSLDGYTTHTYSYYVEEQSSYDPSYDNNDTTNGVSSGIITVNNTIYPEILPDTAVFDFGLPMNVDVLDNDRKSLNINGVALVGVSTSAPTGVTLNTGVSTSKQFASSCGGNYGTFSVLDNQVRYTPATTNVPGTETIYYEILVPGVGYMYSRLDVAPATNIYYEESFLTNNGFELYGTTDARSQSSANVLYGNDTAYDAYEEDSLGSCYAVTVTDPLVQPTASFTFTGTGFDIISRSTPDSGVMVVEVYSGSASGSIARRFLTDNYLENDSYYQLPVVHCTDLTYGTYYVKITAYYNRVFDHNVTATKSVSASKMAGVLKDLGWEEDAEYVYTPSVSEGTAKRNVSAAAEGSYNVYVDGVRIYNPLGSSPSGVGGTLYAAATETNPDYVQIRSLLLDASSWDSTGDGVVNGAMYIADSSSTNDPDDPYVTTGIYLSTSGVLNTETEDGKTYLLDADNNRIQFEGEDVWTQVEDGTRKYYYGTTELTKQQVNTLELSYYDNVYRSRGPENEAYLADGDGIAFEVDDNTVIHISAKSPKGQPVSLCVYDGTKWNEVAVITSATEMFYDLTPYVSECGNNVIIKCVSDSDGILALCQVKLVTVSTRSAGLKMSSAVAYKAIKAMEASDVLIPAHNHVWTLTSTTATCTQSGTATYTCSVCGESFTERQRARGHSYTVEVTPVVDCRSNGSMVFTCTDCGKTITRILPKESHHFTRETTAAEGNNPGYTTYTCTGCGLTYRVTENPCTANGHTETYVNNQNGTHTATCSVCGNTYVQYHTYVDGVCVCGAEDPNFAELKISAAYLRLGADIDMIFCAEVPNDFSSAYLTVTMNDVEYTVTDHSLDSQGRYCFSFENITPQCMADNICATVYGTRNGNLYAYTLDEYSVKTYCANLLANNSDNATLKTLLSDLLTYGAAAQTYTGYKADALVTDGLDLTPGTFPQQPAQSAVTFEGTKNNSLDWTSASLVLRSNLAVRFYFRAQSVEGLTAEVMLEGENISFSAADFRQAPGKTDVWYFDVTGISATQFAETLSANLYQNGVQSGRTISYSVNSYICAMFDVSDESNLAQLVRALYNYGVSASAYAEAQ